MPGVACWPVIALLATAAAEEPGFPFGPGPVPSPAKPEAPEENGKPEKPSQPSIKTLDDGRVQVGDVILDRKTREIRFPAEVNMAGGELLEFAIVHQNGKIHESLLATRISALHLNIAFKLLRYRASSELYPLPVTEEDTAIRFPEVEAAVKAASRFEVKVEWKDGERTRQALINEWITDSSTGRSMPADPWVYGGSFTANGRFAAEATGDILAIFLSTNALGNFSGDRNQSDEVWLPFPKRVPEPGTPVTVIIQPFSKASSEKQ